MKLQGLNVGIGLCGSFCTFKQVIKEIENMVNIGINVIPVMSFNAQSINTRFGEADYFKKQIEDLTGNHIITTIEDAEPIGPKKLFDIMIVAPCTGNSLAKLNFGITDTPVLMACKAHLRNNKPLVIAIATNDALGVNFENIGSVINKKNIYFVPFGQDDYLNKPKSMISNFSLIIPTLEQAMEGNQIQPIII